MALKFAAYFDASGKPSDRAKTHSLCVSGFVSTEEKWRKFEVAWTALLKRYDIPAPFHMADFMAHKGVFKAWMGADDGQDTARAAARIAARDAFRLDAVGLLGDHTYKPFAVSVMLPALRRMFTEYEVPAAEAREPYVWCAIRACSLLIAWGKRRAAARPNRAADSVHIVFEAGDTDQGKFKDAFWERYKLPLNFRTNNDKTLLPFQASDFLAWEFRNWARERTTGFFLQGVAARVVFPEKRRQLLRQAAPHLKTNPVITELVRRLPSDAMRHMDWPAMERYCERWGYTRLGGS